MNAIGPIEAAPQDSWNQAIQAANGWRGEALQCFALAEAAVSETLLHLAGLDGQPARIRLRQLVGQRFGDLEAALVGDGSLGDVAGPARASLCAFRRHEGLRPYLCHGVAKVALDRQGGSILILKLLAFQGQAHERTTRVLEQREAELLLAELRRDARQLGSALGMLRGRLGGTASKPGPDR